MEERENKSEVARIMRQIELEYEAAQRGMFGFAAGTAKPAYCGNSDCLPAASCSAAHQSGGKVARQNHRDVPEKRLFAGCRAGGIA